MNENQKKVFGHDKKMSIVRRGRKEMITAKKAGDNIKNVLKQIWKERKALTPFWEPSHGDWPEDFHHENGNYQNRCMYCEKIFLGYKRRVVCKICEEKRG